MNHTHGAPVSDHLITLENDITLPFSASRFGIDRFPVEIGEVIPPQTQEDLPCALDMLFCQPNFSPALPSIYTSSRMVSDFIVQSLSYQDMLMPGWRKTHYAYLTVDQRTVPAGRTHRNAGWHFDGMQGARYAPKLPACHQYVMSDGLCTEFSDMPTDATGLDELKDNWFTSLGSQIDPGRETYRPEPYEIVLMSAYQMHRSIVCTQEQRRTFLRLDISMKQQDRAGNTVNPAMPAPWPFHKRDLPAGLASRILDAGWKTSDTLFDDRL